MYADGARFQSRDAPEILRILQLAISAKSHGMREIGRSYKTGGNPSLEVSGKQQRKLGFALQAVEKLCRLVRLRAQKKWTIHRHAHGERAHVIFLHRLAKL